jgi:hypothetical protein
MFKLPELEHLELMVVFPVGLGKLTIAVLACGN